MTPSSKESFAALMRRKIIGREWLSADLCLLLSAFSPLFLIGAVRAQDEKLMFTLLGIGVVFTASLLLPILGAQSRAARSFHITGAESASGEVAAYVATYILPLLLVDDRNVRDFIAYALLLTLIGLIFVRGRLLHYNPWIFVFGRRIYSVRVANKHYYLITDTEPRAEQDINAKLFADRFMLT